MEGIGGFIVFVVIVLIVLGRVHHNQSNDKSFFHRKRKKMLFFRDETDNSPNVPYPFGSMGYILKWYQLLIFYPEDFL